MFRLFYNLYFAMFTGSWTNFNTSDIKTLFTPGLDVFGKLLTSIFGDRAVYGTLGTDLTLENIWAVVALVLALITSIGIVVMAVKGIKRIFSVFFYGVR